MAWHDSSGQGASGDGGIGSHPGFISIGDFLLISASL